MIPATDAERIQEEKDAIRHLYRLWAELVREEAIPELLQMITPDAVFLPENAPQLAGREKVEALYRQTFAAYRVEQSFREQELIVCGDFAVARGFEDLKAIPKDGGQPSIVEGRRVLMVLQRGQDGRWRFARSMTNSYRPG